MRAEYQDIYELTPLQEAMLVQSLYTPETAVYNIPTEFELHGELDVKAFEAAWRKLVERHDVLRTSLVWEDLERPYQVVHPVAKLTITRHDWRNLPADERDARMQAHFEAERTRVFSLTEAPLVRASLLRVADDIHRFILTAHHAVLEGWSIGILMREAGQLYEKLVRGTEAAMPPARQFVEYIRWLRKRDQTAAEAYWRETFQGLVAPARLRVDHAGVDIRAAAKTNDTRAMTLPRTLSDQLRGWARTHRLTLNTTFQGLWALLLSRHTGSADVVFGIAVSGRPAKLAGAESIAGMFVNTLPVRVTVQEADRLLPWLQSLQRQQAEAGQYEFAALRQVQAWSGVSSSQPLFDNLFIFQNVAAGLAGGEWAPGITVHPHRALGGSDQPITLNIAPASKVRAILVYNPNLFDGATVENMLAQYRTLLEGLVAGADRPLSSLSMLSEAERRRVLVDWNDSTTLYPRDACIHQLLEEQAARTPEAIAVSSGDETLTYAALHARANRLAHDLQRFGVGPDVPVAICVERSPAMVVGILGILKAGGAYLPLDPDSPRSRLALIVQDATAAVVLTDERSSAAVEDCGARLIRLDRIEPEDGGDAPVPSAGAAAESLAYLLYTSGSTGRPKGVAVPHRSLVNHMAWMQRAFPLGPDDRVLQKTPYTFDASVWEFFAPLLAGATLVVARPDGHRDPGYLAECFRHHRITVLQVVPSLLRALLDANGFERSTLRRVFCGGEALPRELAERFAACTEASLHNLYGPTEATIDVTCHAFRAEADGVTVPIGRPIDNVQIYLLDRRMEPVPVGVSGELYVGGDAVSRGYPRDTALTAAKFVPDPFGDAGGRLYRTGDLARWLPGGVIEFIGRVDHQVKVRGFRIELGEIEAALVEEPAVRDAVVLCREDVTGEKELVAYVVSNDGHAPSLTGLRAALADRLPEYMLPAVIVFVDAMPLTPSGKVDRRALPEPGETPRTDDAKLEPRSDLETRIAGLWRELLRLEHVGVRDNFNDVGGNSLRLIMLHRRLTEEFGADFPVLELFRLTTVEAQARRLSGDGDDETSGFASIRQRVQRRADRSTSPRAVAIVGMSGRFPGANGIDEFWANLRDGVESIDPLTDEQILAAGVAPALLRHPDYVKAGTFLDGTDRFDAPFFGYTPRQTEIIDPQQRMFLECAWEAIEAAGYDPGRYDGAIGVFAGVAKSTYLDPETVDPELRSTVGWFQLLMGNDKDYLPTRVSYKLDLSGPSINVQTACSSSLVATHLAVQSLLNDECDMAIAGGASIHLPQGKGYPYYQDGIGSRDGHCRAFDAGASGTVGGNGVALVLIKRLEDAIAAGDQVIAVIRGSAINNDGADKIGYTAPSINRQAEVIFAAQTLAAVDPRSITYVETHGTGTALGDPIEIEALSRAFRAGTDATGFCAIGSVKTNVGHLDTAAGVTGLIKTALALRHRTLPPSLNFRSPNPQIDFANSPFFVNTELREWEPDRDGTLRAGVSSFGIGGTNAHVVLEEAPAVEPSDPAKPWQLLTLSARTASALEQATDDLAAHLKGHPDLNPADVAYTLQVGRKEFAHRRVVVCEGVSDAVEALESRDRKRVVDGVREPGEAPVVFMFTGQGAQYPNMALGLYGTEPAFRSEVDHCCKILRGPLGLDLRELLFPPEGQEESAKARLDRTEWTQPALFVIEYALARLWMSWGVVPSAMIGHSIGEYVAACLSDVMSLEDSLGLVAERGRLMGALPGGSMLVVPLPEEELAPLLGDGLSIATLNGPSMSVVSGEDGPIAALAEQLRDRGVEPRVLHTSHAFHSSMMDPILEPFTDRVRKVALESPRIPYVSNVTGGWITESEATDPGYWASHLRHAVRFSDGLETLFADPERVLLEVGPGHTLASLARRHPSRPREQSVASSLRHPTDDRADDASMLEGVGRLWLAGVRPDWSGVHSGERRHRVVLPTYPFERQRYWIESSRPAASPERLGREPDARGWLYVPSWKPAPVPAGKPDATGSRWLLFTDADGLGDDVADLLTASGAAVTRVAAGTRYDAPGAGRFVIDPDDPAHYRRLLESLDSAAGLPDRIVHLWSAEGDCEYEDGDRTATRGFYSILRLIQAMDGAGVTEPLDFTVVTRGVHAVTGAETLCPAQATALGPCKVLAQEFPNVRTRSMDVDAVPGTPALAAQLARDLCRQRDEPVVAYRGGRRWVQGFERIRVDLAAADHVPEKLRMHGVYVITGGLGGVGLELAEWLARSVQAKLVLVGRSGLEPGAGDDAVSRRRVALVKALEAAGAEVLVCRADVTDAVEMRKVFAAARQRFGAVHGAIHAAGADDALTPLRSADRAACERVLVPKLRGLEVLAEVVAGHGLDFCLVHSSLSSVMGAMEMSAYVAAHQFMDTFVHQQDRTSDTTWMTVNWETWRTWRTEDVTYPAGIVEFLMEREEFGDALGRVLSLDAATQVLVSTGDVQGRIDRWTRREGVDDASRDPIAEPAAHYPRPTLPTDYVAPRNETEENLVELWQAALGIDRVGVYDNLLDLGADSVVVIQIGARAKALGIELTPKQMFTHPTIAELAAMVSGVDAATDAADSTAEEAPPLVAVPRDRSLSLSFAQQRLWFLDQLGMGSSYNISQAFRLSGPLDATALQQAFDEIVRRHEILRTTYSTENGEPVQHVQPNGDAAFSRVDLRNLDEQERQSELERHTREESELPFDLTQGPLLRVALLRLDDEEHVLLLVKHHIVTDGWSEGVLFRELAILYDAYRDGKASPLPELELQYADFASWQRRWLSGRVLDRHVAYWRDNLADLPALELPTDRPRAANPGFRGDVLPFRLGRELTGGLRTLSRDHGCTLAMTLVAGFKVLMSRYAGQDDVVVGTPIANRNRPELENLIGFFVNSLVLRTDLSGDPSFADTLRRVHATSINAYEHAELPFEQLVNELEIPRDLSRNPLFQVTFGLQNALGDEFTLAGLELQRVRMEVKTSRFDLEVHAYESPEGLTGVWLYDSDLFDHDTIGRMSRHYQTILERVIEDPAQPLSRIALLSTDERRTLLVDWNDTAADLATDRCLHEQFQEQARRTPDSDALVVGHTRLSFAELDDRSNRLGRALRARGVGPDVPVALCTERTVEMVVGVLGILKAGGAYVPLDPAYPAERLRFILDDVRAPLLLTQQSVVEDLPESNARVVCLDTQWPEIANEPATPWSPTADPANLGYIIYTSGSTGRPKGVAIAHDSAVSLIRWAAPLFDERDRRGLLASTSLCFDLSVFELFLPLCCGGTVILAENALALPALPARDEVTLVNTVPSAVTELLRLNGLPASVRTVCLAGEPLLPVTVDALYDRGVEHVYDLYGPSEDTTYSTFTRREPGGPATIGRPIANEQVYVLDAALEPVPIGIPGELYIGGAGLARGYFERPALTAEGFVPDPFVSEPGARLYRTGDVVRYRADGNLEFLGRNDHQVKIRGFRIELGEIESALRDLDAVRDTVVTARPDHTGSPGLVAYVVPATDEAAQREDEQIGQWEAVWEETYDRPAGEIDPTFDITGWSSSYTGLPIPAAEMRAWVDGTVQRIGPVKALRVLEIGCGSGLLLFRVAPDAEKYDGWDFSEDAVAAVRRHVADAGLSSKVRLEHRRADDTEQLAQDSYDTVILNSVVQYFPSVKYLLKVLAGAIGAVRDGGVVYVGDVRSLPLLGAFHASVLAHQATDDGDLETLRRRIRERVAQEEELALDPALFVALCEQWDRVTHVEVMPKRGAFENELSTFRYDVRLYIGTPPSGIVRNPVWSAWDQEDLETLRSTLEQATPEVLAYRDVPNARTAGAALAAEDAPAGTVGELRAQMHAAERGGVDPESLCRLGEELGYGVDLSWARSGTAGRYDVLLVRQGVRSLPVPRLRAKAWSRYGNNPLQAKMTRQLAPRLREGLAQDLPEHMVPASYVMLDALPLTPNGKIDRAALPEPDWYRTQAQRAYVAPRGPTEERLAAVWAEVLGLDRVGVEDNFFELGGHSLLATQMIARIREEMLVDLSVRSVFEHPCVRQLAGHIDSKTAGPVAAPIVPIERSEPLPLSSAQQRLWFLDRLGVGAAYNMPQVLQLHGPLDTAALEGALTAIVERHEVLRTVFPAESGQPLQTVFPEADLAVECLDLTTLPERERAVEATRLVEEDAGTPFDLSRGPLLRAKLIRLRPEEHVLLVTVHHIACDGWSFGVLNHELSHGYTARVQGRSPELPALTIHYADYAHWQRRQLPGDVLDAKLAYWREHLGDAPRSIELPTDHPRPAVQTYGGAIHDVALPPVLAESLRQLGREHGATLAITMLAAFDALMSRYTGQDDIVVGSPIANRARPELEKLIGFFVNTVAIRVDLSGDPPFAELLGRAKQATLSAQEHQDIPFEQLVDELDPVRDPSRSPLFQVVFSMQNTPRSPLALEGVAVRPFGSKAATVRFDLECHVWELRDEVVCRFVYNTDLFDDATIERMADHFRTLLEGVAADPTTQLSRLPLLHEAERRHVLSVGAEEGTSFPTDPRVHERFEKQAAISPDATALTYEDRHLTYDELNARANRLAHYLRARGVGPEVLVGVCIERSLDLVIAILGVLKAGGAYVPLDPGYPKQRLSFILDDSRMHLLLTQSDLAGDLPDDRGEVVCLDTAVADIDRQPETDPAPVGTPDDTAYVIYTSGSTGTPKGVPVQHDTVARLFGATEAWYGFDERDIWTLFHSCAFDFSVWEMWGALLYGGRLVVVPYEVSRSPEEFHALVHREGVTVLNQTPSAFRQFINADAVAEGSDDLALRFVIFGGEALELESLRPWFERHGDERPQLVNMYGITETTVHVTYRPLGMADLSEAPGSVIGRPIPDLRVLVLDTHGQPCPIGVPGELYVGGAGVARGYLGRPALTAERFVPDPFGDAPGGRLYRTGDVARLLANGDLEYLGRNDEQVKVRGFRIELGEIEAALLRHERVREAVAMVREDDPGTRRIVAYVATDGDDGDLVSELRASVAEQLPQYMVPAAFVRIESVPLTAHGKVDRRALPTPTGEREASDDGYVAPRTEAEVTLVAIWADLLRVERVGVHDNFFELGGDSILSIQIIARAREVGLHLTPRQMFQHQTVAELAAVAETTTLSSIAAEQGPVVGDVVLTPIQRWFFEQERVEPHHYNQAMLLTVRERLDCRVVEQAVDALLAHHDALRLRFAPGAPAWRQLGSEPGGDTPFEFVDLSSLGEDEQHAAISARAEALQASLVLDDGPLVRVAQFDLGQQRPGRLLIIIHHLAVDAVSWRILREDLQRACMQLACGEPVQLPPKTTSYRQWAQRLEAHAQSEQVQAELEKWLEQPWDKAGAIPTDGHVERNTVGRAMRCAVHLSEVETRALLSEVPRAYNTQIDDVLLTALAQAFAPWTGRTCLLVDLEGHGREDLFDDVDLSRTVGWFTSIYPLLVDIGGADGQHLPAGAALKSVKEQLRFVPNRGVGYGLLRYLGDDGRLEALPQPQVSFNYLGQLDQMVEAHSMFDLAHEPAGPLKSPRDRRTHLLEVDGAVIRGQLHMSFAYGSDVHDAGTIEAVAERFRSALLTLLDHCTAPGVGGSTPSDFPLAHADQRALDRIVAKHGPDAMEDLYPLSPMQQGMLFHSEHDPTGVYVEQFCFAVEGLDAEAFRRAWQAIIERHPALRTSIVGSGSEQPLQLVHRRCELPFTEHDCSAFSEAEQERWLERFVKEDRGRGIDLGAPPPMRIALIRLGDRRYELIWTFHHIALDGWSFPLVFNEVLKVYEAKRRAETPALPRIRPYRDHIAWLERQDDEEANAYWRRTLEGFKKPTTIFETPSRRGTQNYAFEDGRLTAECTESLQSLASREQVTLNTLLVGAWALLLSRYSAERDVVLGTIASGRPAGLEGVESMVGLFVNTLPLRVNVPDDQPVAAWLRDVQQRQAELRQYEHSPLWEVQRHADLPAGARLFESLFVFENYPVDLSAVRASDVTFRMKPTESRSGYPLALRVGVTDAVSMRVTYDRDRFDSASMQRFVGHLQTLLESFAADPAQSVGDVTMLNVAEEQRILVEWNATSRPRSHEQAVHRLFEERVREAPDARAVVFDGTSLTYAELNARANRLAHHLRRHGVGPESIVGLCVDRSFDLVVGMLGIWKAGGALLGLDSELPKARLSFLVEDARPPVVLTQQSLLADLPPHPGKVLCLDADWPEIEKESELDLQTGPRADNPAYVIHTSGSTGKAKGVVVTHRSLANFLAWSQRAFPLGADDAVLAKTMYSFDNSMWETFAPLLSGARVILAGVGGHRDPDHLIELMQQHRVTALKLVPSLLDVLLKHGGLETCTALRFVLCGGEPLTAELAGRARAQLSATLHNNYGSTETTIDVTVHVDREGAGEAGEAGEPIGRPIDNVRTYILDASMRPVAIGVVGELYVGGAGLARGYLNDPVLTATKFVPDAFDSEGGARLYRTGDRCRHTADGDIEFIGRADHQVNLRGFRIELGEIEAVLREYDAVQDAVVTLQEIGEGDDRLVAYVVTDGIVSESELGRIAAQRLPSYMVPSVFVTLDELPLTSGGKVDRKELPAATATRQVADEYVAPRSGFEEQIAAIWRDVLRVDAVGVHDNFFELGGHSLLATQVVSRLRSVLDVDLPLREFFDRPTIAELATRLGASEPTIAKGTGIVAAARDGELPLSFAQQRMWFLDQIGTAAAYNLSISLRLEGDLDVGALEDAINAIVERHEVLRTLFPSVDGAPAQEILPELRIAVSVVDLRGFDPDARARTLTQHQELDALTPFDLSSGPLIRAKLLWLEDRAHALLLTLHHIVFDGWSAGVFMRELVAHYRALTIGEPVRLGDMPIQYADFSQWQRRWMQSEAFERQLAYWRERLADVAVLQLPTDRPRPPVQTFHGAKHSFQLPLVFRRGLVAVGRDRGATLAMTLLAAYQVLLSRYASQDEVVVGTPIANRNRHETENLIGFFVNTLAMRTDLSGDPTFMELLGRVKEVALGAYEHQDVPFERLVEELQPERNLSQNPIFQTLFIMQNAPRETQPLEGLTSVPLRSAAKTARFDMELLAGEFDKGIAFELVYNTDLFDASTIERFARHLRLLLERIAAAPDARLSDLMRLDPEEERRVLTTWNQTSVAFPEGRCLHDLFESQADRTPYAPAVRFDTTCLTYRDVEERANRLAALLRGRGVGPGTRVGICVERSPEVVVGVLGIHKAGGAYVPLDPDYPAARLEYMMASSGASVIVGHAPTRERLAALLDASTAGRPEVVLLDGALEELHRHSPERVSANTTPTDLAYVLFTSGSTGRPKAVAMPHGPLVNLIDWQLENTAVGPGARTLQFAPFSFDVSCQELFTTLASGGELCLIPDELRRDPGELLAFLSDAKVARLFLPFVALQQLAELAVEHDLVPASLREVITAGEQLQVSPALVELFRRIPGCVLVNQYGPTECHVVSSHTLRGEPGEWPVLPPIGRPIANTRLYVLDERERPMPVGVPGELYVGGAALARGYLNDEALTAERFVADPFGVDLGLRLYRTGDLARYRDDGQIEFIGRKDHQVKLRGYRVELGEVEAVLLEHRAVQQAAVIVREDVPGDSRLVAYFVGANETASVTAADMRAFAGERLPSYMVPSAFVALDALPLTPSGKVARGALPEPSGDRELTDDYVAPRTDPEQRIAEIWKRVLGVDQVGAHDNFFHLGGHSLLATQVVSRIRSAFEIALPLRRLFERPTVAELADEVEHVGWLAGHDAVVSQAGGDDEEGTI